VPLDRLADAVTPSTALLAVSAVQSADGRLADLAAIERSCATTGTRVYLDTTQAVGWLPIEASRYAYTVCSGYKWLLAPRGTAFFTVSDTAADDLIPHHAGWYAGDQPWNSIYGSPLRLAADARRFDVSPAWHSWVGQAPALELLADVGVATLHRHAVGLANQLRLALDLPPGDSAIVSLDVDEGGVAELAAAQITAAFRNGRLRLSFHLYNTQHDADRAAEALSGHLAQGGTA
jgi:selenocysteine lyase/cysteine desulfurase